MIIRRTLGLFRRFTNLTPGKNDSLTAKEKEAKAIQEVYDEETEKSKKELDIWFPDPNTTIERQKFPEYPSNYGKSDEEDTPAFFLDDLKDFQYIYTPKQKLEFDENGFSLIYKSQKNSIFWPFKLTYCWKLIYPVIFSLGITLHAQFHTNLAILLSWSIPFILYTKALKVKEIYLKDDGKTLKIVYKRFRFWPSKSKIIDVSRFKEPSGDSFIVWSVYEFPDDLKTFNENEAIARISFAKYLNFWDFFLLPAKPAEINREVLINVLNGIFIDFAHAGDSAEDLKSRYFILSPKTPS
jgi:hypothetical protein